MPSILITAKDVSRLSNSGTVALVLGAAPLLNSYYVSNQNSNCNAYTTVLEDASCLIADVGAWVQASIRHTAAEDTLGMSSRGK